MGDRIHTHLGEKLDSRLQGGGQGSGSTELLGPECCYLRFKNALGTYGTGSCHFVWSLGSDCLFSGSAGTEGMLLPLILYFGTQVWEYPVGFLHSLFLESSFWSRHKERFPTENPWGDMRDKYLVYVAFIPKNQLVSNASTLPELLWRAWSQGKNHVFSCCG